MVTIVAVGLIGGSGLGELVSRGDYSSYPTPYGEIEYISSRINGIEVVFIPRHGRGHRYPPHKINFKGNMYLFASMGIDKVVATSAVGSLNESLPPGSIILVDQFIDYTKRRVTFYEDHVVHVDVTRPYCKGLMKILYGRGRELGLRIRLGGIYICSEGPRFETPAEIKMFRLMGGDLVGMTNVPEVVLARELGIHYVLIAIVTNYAAGMQERVSQEEVLRVMNSSMDRVRGLIFGSLREIDEYEASDDCIQYREYANKYILGGFK